MTIVCVATWCQLFAADHYEGGTHYSIPISLSQYIGLATIVCSWSTYFLSRQYFKIVILITLFLGIINVASYTLNQYGFGITIHLFEPALYLGLQPFSVLIAGSYLIINRDKLASVNEVEIKHQEQTLSADKIESFKNRYENFSTDKLIEIAKDKRYTGESKKAALDIIADRKKEESSSA